MAKMITGCLALIALWCSTANAGLIEVRFDDFSTAGNPSTVFNFDGFNISRTRTGGSQFGAAVGMAAPGIMNLSYAINSDFEDLFDFYRSGVNVNPKGTFNANPNFFPFDGFLVRVSASAGTQATASDGVNSYNFGAGIHEFAFRNYLGGTNSFSVDFRLTSGDFSLLNVAAVPEPTSLLMVGSTVLGLVTMRRRKKLV